MALTKVRGGGVDNPLTLGGGSASDRSIIFDGNAQDFHIGLDDSADSLTIGLGSALGTTSHMVFDANGHITKPLQPAFLVHPSTDQNNFSINTDVTVVFDSERFDNNNDFASNTFTAPVTGRYQLNLMLRLNSADTAASYYQVKMVTSNDNYTSTLAPNFTSDPNYIPINSSVLADMDANDTFVVKIYQSGGSAQTDISPNSFVSGFLVA